MVSKWWLRVGLLSMFLLAGCKPPTATPTATPAQAAGSPGYPAPAPTDTIAPPSYPAGTTPTAPIPPDTPTSGPYPEPTAGGLAQRFPL